LLSLLATIAVPTLGTWLLTAFTVLQAIPGMYGKQTNECCVECVFPHAHNRVPPFLPQLRCRRFAKATDILRRWCVVLRTRAHHQRLRKQHAAAAPGLQLPTSLVDCPAVLLMDNADYAAKSYGRNIYDQAKASAHFVYQAVVSLPNARWPPFTTKAATPEGVSAAQPTATAMAESTTEASTKRARTEPLDSTPATEAAFIEPGLGTTAKVPRSLLTSIAGALGEGGDATTLFGVHGLRGIEAELREKLRAATADGSSDVDATDLNAWMGILRPPTPAPDVHVHTLEPVDVPASSDQGILSALLAAGQALKVWDASGRPTKYVVVVVDQAIYARVWRLLQRSKSRLDWVLPVPGMKVALVKPRINTEGMHNR